MEFDYKTLMMLRKKTKLKPKLYFEVLRERQAAIDYQVTMNRVENCQLGVDYSKAEQLEAKYRFEKWKKEMFEYWLKCSSGRDLDKYAYDVLIQLMEKEKEEEKQKVYAIKK